MRTDWRLSSFNGALLAAYFIPTWTIVAFKIMISPIQGLYERPNVSVALFISDHLQLAAMTTIRKAGGCDEALAMALAIGSVISFVSMLMAAQVGESQALKLHATELLMLLGTAIVLLVEPPARPQPAQAQVDRNTTADALTLEQAQLLNNR